MDTYLRETVNSSSSRTPENVIVHEFCAHRQVMRYLGSNLLKEQWADSKTAYTLTSYTNGNLTHVYNCDWSEKGIQ